MAVENFRFFFFAPKGQLTANFIRSSEVTCRAKVASLGGSVGCASDWRPGGRGFDPRQGRQYSFVEIGHEIFSTVILSLPDSRRAVVSFWQKNVHSTG